MKPSICKVIYLIKSDVHETLKLKQSSFVDINTDNDEGMDFFIDSKFDF